MKLFSILCTAILLSVSAAHGYNGPKKDGPNGEGSFGASHDTDGGSGSDRGGDGDREVKFKDSTNVNAVDGMPTKGTYEAASNMLNGTSLGLSHAGYKKEAELVGKAADLVDQARNKAYGGGSYTEEGAAAGNEIMGSMLSDKNIKSGTISDKDARHVMDVADKAGRPSPRGTKGPATGVVENGAQAGPKHNGRKSGKGKKGGRQETGRESKR